MTDYHVIYQEADGAILSVESDLPTTHDFTSLQAYGLGVLWTTDGTINHNNARVVNGALVPYTRTSPPPPPVTNDDNLRAAIAQDTTLSSIDGLTPAEVDSWVDTNITTIPDIKELLKVLLKGLVLFKNQ